MARGNNIPQEDWFPQYDGINRMVSGGVVTGSQNYQERDTNWWKRCAVGKGHTGTTPSACGYYKRAVRNGIKPVPKSKSSKPSPKSPKSSQSHSRETYASTSRPSRRLHPDTAPAKSVVGRIILVVALIAVVSTVIAFFVMEDRGQPNPITPPAQNNQEAVATQPPIAEPPIDETNEERTIRETQTFRMAEMGGESLSEFVERIATDIVWSYGDMGFGWVAAEGETEHGLLVANFQVDIGRNAMWSAIDLQGQRIDIMDLWEMFQ